jgi:hypothetical protein
MENEDGGVGRISKTGGRRRLKCVGGGGEGERKRKDLTRRNNKKGRELKRNTDQGSGKRHRQALKWSRDNGNLATYHFEGHITASHHSNGTLSPVAFQLPILTLLQRQRGRLKRALACCDRCLISPTSFGGKHRFVSSMVKDDENLRI